MTKTPLLALYSLAHFWVDLSCALLAFRSLSASPDFALCLLLYNFCAFALQMPLGLLADRLDRNGAVAAAGCALVALAYAVPLPLAAAVTAGVGNALFHLGGGIDTLNTGLDRSAALGIFVSPGAVGLFLGTLWGRGDAAPLWAGPVGLLLLAGAILWLCRRTFGSLRSGNVPLDPTPREGWGPLVPLFLVVDEPVSMLDVSVRADIINMLLDLTKKYQTSILFISHDIAAIRYVASRTAVMYLGRIVEMGDTDALIQHPMHPYTQALVSNCASIDIDSHVEKIHVEGEPPSPVDPGPGCYFADRCPRACEKCRQEYPQETRLPDGRVVACHLVNEGVIQ